MHFICIDWDGLLAEWARILLLDPGPDALCVIDVLDMAGQLTDDGLSGELFLADRALDVRLALIVDAAGDSIVFGGGHEVRFRVSNRSVIEERIDDERVAIDGGLLWIGGNGSGLLRYETFVLDFLIIGSRTKRALATGASPSQIKQAAALHHGVAERVCNATWRLSLAQGSVAWTPK